MWRWALASFGMLLSCVLWPRGEEALRISPERISLRADGVSSAVVSIQGPRAGLEVLIREGKHRARVELCSLQDGRWRAIVRAGLLAGPVVMEATAPHFRPASLRFSTTPSDNADLLRLDDPADARAFRSWFTFLAEAQYFRKPEELPREITDCAALIRYAYREALREHDGAWPASLGLRYVPGIPQIAKYQYPFTPAGAGLFRVPDGGYAQFADAKTLMRWNTRFIGRDVECAEPGDLLFYRQADRRMPFHSMIYLGASTVERGGARLVLYHTGSDGEIRRPALVDLMRHPQPEWRPARENESFLGVYRWNIL